MPLRGILVGLGGRSGTWLQAVENHPETEWAGFVEVSPENRSRAIRNWGVPEDRIYPDLKQAAANCRADFVMDVTPPSAHEAISTTAFEAGLHVIGEKPMSDDFAAARRMVRRAQSAGLRHMITQNYRFGSQPRTTRRILQEGIIGRPEQVDILFTMPWADSPGSHYVTEPYMFTKDMGIHHFDMLRYVLNRDPISVRCVSWNPSWAWHKGDSSHVAIFDFGSGLMAVHRGVGAAVGQHTDWNGEWRIEGVGGTITWEGGDIWRTHLHRAEQRRREQVFPDRVGSGVAPLLDEFVAAVREQRDPECSSSDNLKSLAMVAGAVESAESGGKEVRIADLLDA